MKKFLMALAATTMVASPMVTAQAQAAPQRVDSRTVKQAPNYRPAPQKQVVQKKVVQHKTVVRKDDHRRWAKGQRFDRRYATNYRVIDNYRGYRLNAPPRGYQWVRSGNDAILVAITSGIIGAVIANVIN